MRSAAPAITEDPQSIFVGVGLGRNATFSCSAYGGPTNVAATHPLIFTWTGPDNVNITNQVIDIVNDTATSILTLVNVTDDHEGNYTCSVAYSDEPDLISTRRATLSAVSKLLINILSSYLKY